ncbi:biotin/lipoyl-binding protein [Paenibacillus sp. KQZ6P-2]|uniref:Biotin/lipoyl-binding protein n=1 Tax=Paenibacillus mangrovi TaxID=2931978 RepID=A0A9X2B3K1_9BACL|nr:biotin/lipoyl-binding protein [Paenibacillus mangrovi]MCJ8013694.1 biotin/lipoyl-binding protein [Paenibacillus mangrovi]
MEVEISQSRKRKVRLIAGLFIALLLLFTFAGNNLQTLTLPKVMTAKTSKGSLVHTYESRAVVTPSEVSELTNPAGWKVANVLVKKGDVVQQGQVLIEYDGSDIKQQIADEQSALKKLQLSMEQLNYNVILAMQGEDEAAKISATAALELAKVDVSIQQQHIQNLNGNLAANRQLKAPFQGIVMDVGAIEGYSSTGKPDITISNTAKGYKFTLLIPSPIASKLSVGDTLKDVSLPGKEGDPIPLSGTISKIDASPGSSDNPLSTSDEKVPGSMNQVEIALKDRALHGGEQVDVKIAQSNSGDAILVPNQAIHKDQEGAYVFALRESQGPLGNAYYAVRTNVQITDANDTTTAVSVGLFEDQEIIVDSNDLITDGTRVHE